MDNRVKQLSLFDTTLSLAGAMPSVKASMRRIIGEEGECRKGFVDKLNFIASQSQIKLTGGNYKQISLDTLNKILSPSDICHPPSILFILVFCQAAKDYTPLRLLTQSVGFELMSEEDKKYRDYGKAIIDEKEARKRKKLLEERL